MTEKNTAYEQMMFADYPDIVGIEDLQVNYFFFWKKKILSLTY